MWDDAFVKFMVVLVLFVLVIWFETYYVNKAKESIVELLFRNKCQVVEISRVWNFGKRELSFDVKYRNSQGELTINTCVIGSGWFSPGDVYWKKPI